MAQEIGKGAGEGLELAGGRNLGGRKTVRVIAGRERAPAPSSRPRICVRGKLRRGILLVIPAQAGTHDKPDGGRDQRLRKRPMLTLRTMKPLFIAALVFAAAGLSACGVRGPLDPPTQATAEGQAKSSEAGDAGENSAAKPKPHEDFILDPLLR